MSVLTDAGEIAGDLRRLRHALHEEPEIGLVLPRTQEKVLRALEGLPLQITTGRRTTSVTAVLSGAESARDGGSAPVVLLRGDMDALPVQERVDVPFRSRVEGAMHACGHDLHTSMLVGAARLLSGRREQLCGDVVFMFQPGEEGWDGAAVMIDEGVLDAAGRRADAAFGMHVFSGLEPHGRFFTKPGPMLAASDELHVTVQGAGGHGASPHLARDPVPAAAEMVAALHTMVTRKFDIFDPVLVTVGLLRAGTKANIIPDTAMFHATVRTYSRESRDRMMEAAPRLVRGIAAAHGLDVTVDYIAQYPVTVNDAGETEFAAAVVAELFGEERNGRMAHPWGMAEDFSRVLDQVPGTFIGLSAVPHGVEPATAAFNHSPYAQYDDAVLPDGAALYAALALRRLQQLRR
jgi:amidohydrolase